MYWVLAAFWFRFILLCVCACVYVRVCVFYFYFFNLKLFFWSLLGKVFKGLFLNSHLQKKKKNSRFITAILKTSQVHLSWCGLCSQVEDKPTEMVGGISPRGQFRRERAGCLAHGHAHKHTESCAHYPHRGLVKWTVSIGGTFICQHRD